MNFPSFKVAFYNKNINKRSLFATLKNDELSFFELLKFHNRYKNELGAHKSLFNLCLLGNNNLPKSYVHLSKSMPLYNTNSLERELSWQALGFLQCIIEINNFIDMRATFEHKVLIGNYGDARDVLNLIDSSICVSYWSAENRLIIDELEFGSKRNWETRNLFMNEENDNDLKILGDFYSVKSESKYSFFQFNEYFNDWEEYVTTNSGLKNEIRDFFRFKGNYFSLKKYDHLDYLINRESTSSLIDRYIMFVRVIQHSVTYNGKTLKNIQEIVSKLREKINDIELDNISALNTEMDLDHSNVESEILEAIDLYTVGNYEEASILSSQLLSTKCSFNIELIIIYVKSIIEGKLLFKSLTENASLINEISKKLLDIFSKNDNTDKAFVDLVKLSYVFNNSHIGLKLYAVVKEQLGWQTNTDYTFLSHLSSKFLNPILLSSLNDIGEIECLKSNLLKRSDERITSELFLDLNHKNGQSLDLKLTSQIPHIKGKVYAARAYMLNKQYDDSICIYQDLIKNEQFSTMTQYEIVSNLFISYLANRDFENCLKIFVNTYLVNPQLVKKMDFQALINEIITGKFKNVDLNEELIELPIFFRINCNEKIRVKQAYELFLKKNNCLMPSQLIDRRVNLEVSKLIYFLRNVCIPDVMQLSKDFSSSYIVNEERIKICQFLAVLDNENLNYYNHEIALITQKNAISKVIGRIDEGKIYVNDEKLKQFFLRSESPSEVSKLNASTSERYLTKEYFNRTVELQNFTLNNEYKQIKVYYANYDEDGKVVVVKGNPVFSSFKQMFLEVRDNFVANNEYGLNPYLSTRIRHGTLPNHIRSVFESLYLVTAQTDGVYGINEYWDEKLDLDDSIKDDIQKLLAKFSKNVDEISSLLKDEWIQYKTEVKNDKSEALFDYSYITEKDLFRLLVSKFEKYEEFIDFCFNELWIKTERCLDVIRHRLNNEVKSIFTNMITDLEQELEALLNNSAIYELKNNVNLSRTEIQILLSNVAKWFQRSESSFDGEYELLMLAETSIQITKNINPNYRFEIQNLICSTFFIKGEYHQHIIDIIRNFLENMIKRSKLNIEELDPTLSLTENESLLHFSFGNNVSDAVAQEGLLTKLNLIKENWKNPDSNVSQEEGTGFSKIKKILNADLERKHSNFDFEMSEGRLNLSITFETHNLKV